jgi:hypothetical protein
MENCPEISVSWSSRRLLQVKEILILAPPNPADISATLKLQSADSDSMLHKGVIWNDAVMASLIITEPDSSIKEPEDNSDGAKQASFFASLPPWAWTLIAVGATLLLCPVAMFGMRWCKARRASAGKKVSEVVAHQKPAETRAVIEQSVSSPRSAFSRTGGGMVRSPSSPASRSVAPHPSPNGFRPGPPLPPRPSPPTRNGASPRNAPSSPSSKAVPLPENWIEIRAEDGNIYYYNRLTGDSVWDRPTA